MAGVTDGVGKRCHCASARGLVGFNGGPGGVFEQLANNVIQGKLKVRQRGVNVAFKLEARRNAVRGHAKCLRLLAPTFDELSKMKPLVYNAYESLVCIGTCSLRPSFVGGHAVCFRRVV